MDNTLLVQEVAELFRVSNHKVDTSVKINHREIDICAEELTGIVRKTILVECADYGRTVGVEKLTEDLGKLKAAVEELKHHAVIMHVSRHGYSPDAIGYAKDAGIATFTLSDLQSKIVNFEPYVQAVRQDQLRPMILKEYQQNRIHYEGSSDRVFPSLDFLNEWLSSDTHWLTILGDYGVGKSWTLKRFLYYLVDEYDKAPLTAPIPFFIPLQRFTKAFDFTNLVLSTLHLYGVSTSTYDAFEYLIHRGRIVFLLDSFDEMAQQLSRDVIRENLRALLDGIGPTSRAIMTSRPNYFERRAERFLVVERNGGVEYHPLDEKAYQNSVISSRLVQEALFANQFARICDLTPHQRKHLFETVLAGNSPAHSKLMELLGRFHNLDNLSQRAVIARLLTTVVTTLAQKQQVLTVEGYPILPEDLRTLNESKIFEIVIYNLLDRDKGIGGLTAAQRLAFLRVLAVYLQQPGHDLFATPAELRSLVESAFSEQLNRSDMRENLLESFYRTCRRHSGLTTEGQFRDTSGSLDTPVDEADTESRVGFSHNSLREYLVADALIQYIKTGRDIPNIRTVVITDAVADFFRGRAEYEQDLAKGLSRAYDNNNDSRFHEIFFKLIMAFVRTDKSHVSLLGSPPRFTGVDLSDLDLSDLSLVGAYFGDCVAQDTDLRKSDLRDSIFQGCIIDPLILDDAELDNADFRRSEIRSIYVHDHNELRTLALLDDPAARQWLYSAGALVQGYEKLNPLLGQPWYEAAREVTKTLEKRIAGTHQAVSLSKGTKAEYREFAEKFVGYLIRKNILLKMRKSNHGTGYVVKLDRKYLSTINAFSRDGIIDSNIKPFFEKCLDSAKK